MATQSLPQPPTATHCPRPGCRRELTAAERGLTALVGSCSCCADPQPPSWVNYGHGNEWVRVPAGLSAVEFEAWLEQEVARA